MDQSTFEFHAFQTMWKYTRQILETEKFHSDIEWQEGKGMFHRIFTIHGNKNDVDRIKDRLEHWKKCFESASFFASIH